MSILVDFLKSINVQKDILDKLTNESNEDLTAEQLADLSAKYNISREDYFESTILKDRIKEANSEAIQLYNIKMMKTMSNLLGMEDMTNSKIKEFESIDDFLKVATDFKKSHDDNLRNSSDESLKNELDKFKTIATERASKIEELENNFETFRSKKDNEVKDAIDLYRSKDYFHKMVSNDKSIPDVPGKSFVLQSIEEKIFNNYKITPDGKVFNPDNSKAIHPDENKNITVESVEDLFDFYKNQAGLVKRNNSGEGGGKSAIVTTGDGRQVMTGYGEKAAKMAEKLGRSN